MPDEDRNHTTWLSSDRPIPRRFVRPVLRFTHVEASGGLVLLAAAIIALVWANSPFGDSYDTFWDTHVGFEAGPFHLDESLHDWVNDGLMAIFFLVVGMEIKRELVVGDLRDPKRAALPVIAALGGMIVPAAIFIFIVGGGEASRGWGIPMATDIAFSVGIVALLGARVPVQAKLFLLALAIVDDIGAIAVIAVFYTDDLALLWLAGALAALAVITLANRAGIRNVGFYVVVGVAAWVLLLESGVHATLAGVAIGLLTPARAWYSDEDYRRRMGWALDRYEMLARDPRGAEKIDAQALEVAAIARESVSPLTRQEAAIHPWSSFVIVPIFALANAGVRFTEIDVVDAVFSQVALGVTFGLIVGKFVGISVFTWLAVRLGLGKLPRGAGWAHILGLAAIAGIGFTVSLFIAELAYTDAELIDRAKTGIFIGSTLAGVLGYSILRRVKVHPRGPEHAIAEAEFDEEPASAPAQ
jgi:NhaA family Na+:H+ antiporter